jgi:hypothetical protein
VDSVSSSTSAWITAVRRSTDWPSEVRAQRPDNDPRRTNQHDRVACANGLAVAVARSKIRTEIDCRGREDSTRLIPGDSSQPRCGRRRSCSTDRRMPSGTPMRRGTAQSCPTRAWKWCPGPGTSWSFRCGVVCSPIWPQGWGKGSSGRMTRRHYSSCTRPAATLQCRSVCTLSSIRRSWVTSSSVPS